MCDGFGLKVYDIWGIILLSKLVCVKPNEWETCQHYKLWFCTKYSSDNRYTKNEQPKADSRGHNLMFW